MEARAQLIPALVLALLPTTPASSPTATLQGPGSYRVPAGFQHDNGLIGVQSGEVELYDLQSYGGVGLFLHTSSVPAYITPESVMLEADITLSVPEICYLSFAVQPSVVAPDGWCGEFWGLRTPADIVRLGANCYAKIRGTGGRVWLGPGCLVEVSAVSMGLCDTPFLIVYLPGGGAVEVQGQRTLIGS
jgi:hypothetical protein